MLLSAGVSNARAAELEVFTVRAGKTVLDKIAPEFEQLTGNRVHVTFSYGPALVAKLQAGAPFDLLITGAPSIDEWIGKGALTADTRTGLFQSGMGVVLRMGAAKPDVSSAEKLKHALLEAKSVIYLKRVNMVEQLLDRLGIAAAIEPKTIATTSDNVAEAVVNGEAELGITAITQILTTQGADLVGPLPPELQYEITFAAAVSARSTAPDAARALLKFFASPAAIAVIKSQGMEPPPE